MYKINYCHLSLFCLKSQPQSTNSFPVMFLISSLIVPPGVEKLSRQLTLGNQVDEAAQQFSLKPVGAIILFL